MSINFESTMTEADFKRPLLDKSEESLARELLGDADLEVDGLRGSLFSKLVALFAGGR
jgi:hypothetical protein